MKRQLLIRPEAQREIKEAVDWYEQQSRGLGAEFLRVVDAALSAIRRRPFSFPIVDKQFRRALLRRFPYFLVYLVEPDRIVVLACFHARRNPIDWSKRAES